MDEDVIQFNTYSFVPPTTIGVCGPTGCGKSYWVYNLIMNCEYVFENNGKQPQKFVYCYSIYQNLYRLLGEKRQDIIFHQGLPELEFIYELARKQPVMVVLDDLVHKIVENADMLMLFVQGSHHMNISVVFMSQNLYQTGKHARTIALNVKYLVLFANPRDAQQIKYLGRQIFPHSREYLYEAYDDAVKGGSFGYLLVDLHGETSADMRLRTKIFPYDEVGIVYQKK